MMSTFCSMISFQTSTGTRRTNVNDHDIFPRFSGGLEEEDKRHQGGYEKRDVRNA